MELGLLMKISNIKHKKLQRPVVAEKPNELDHLDHHGEDREINKPISYLVYLWPHNEKPIYEECIQ